MVVSMSNLDLPLFNYFASTWYISLLTTLNGRVSFHLRSHHIGFYQVQYLYYDESYLLNMTEFFDKKTKFLNLASNPISWSCQTHIFVSSFSCLVVVFLLGQYVYFVFYILCDCYTEMLTITHLLVLFSDEIIFFWDLLEIRRSHA